MAKNSRSNDSSPAAETIPADTTSAKTAAQLRREYEELCEQCSDLTRQLPAIEQKIRKEVEDRMGEPRKKLESLKARKRLAYLAWEAQFQTEEPERRAEQEAQAHRQAAAEREERARVNRERKSIEQDTLQRRLDQAIA